MTCLSWQSVTRFDELYGSQLPVALGRLGNHSMIFLARKKISKSPRVNPAFLKYTWVHKINVWMFFPSTAAAGEIMGKNKDVFCFSWLVSHSVKIRIIAFSLQLFFSSLKNISSFSFPLGTSFLQFWMFVAPGEEMSPAFCHISNVGWLLCSGNGFSKMLRCLELFWWVSVG